MNNAELKKALKEVMKHIYLVNDFDAVEPTKTQVGFARMIIGRSIAKKLSKYTPTHLMDMDRDVAWEQSPTDAEFSTDCHYAVLNISDKTGEFECQIAPTPFYRNAKCVIVFVKELHGLYRWAQPYINPMAFLVEDPSKIPRNEPSDKWKPQEEEEWVKRNEHERILYMLNRKWELHHAETKGQGNAESFIAATPWITKAKERTSPQWTKDHEEVIRVKNGTWLALVEVDGKRIIARRKLSGEWVDFHGTDVTDEAIEDEFSELSD